MVAPGRADSQGIVEPPLRLTEVAGYLFRRHHRRHQNSPRPSMVAAVVPEISAPVEKDLGWYLSSTVCLPAGTSSVLKA